MTADQDHVRHAAQALEVSVFRFTESPRAMGEFLQLLGLSPRISNSADSWLELQAEQGSVSLHGAGAASTTDARPGSTDLVLIARDVPAFAAGLSEREGIEVAV